MSLAPQTVDLKLYEKETFLRLLEIFSSIKIKKKKKQVKEQHSKVEAKKK